MTVWEILESKLVLLIVGFILTTLAGGLISSWLQRAAWKRQSRVDLYRKRYEEGTQFLNDLSKLIGNRFFLIQRFLWALNDMNEDKIHTIESEYFKIVAEWNSTFWMNRNKIRLLVGEAQANLFLDYQDDHRPDNPQSIHYRFVKAHRFVVGARNKKISVPEAQAEVYRLNWDCSRFLEMLTTDFLERVTSLQLLAIPEPLKKRNRQLIQDNSEDA